jgi:hypothetical protein
MSHQLSDYALDRNDRFCLNTRCQGSHTRQARSATSTTIRVNCRESIQTNHLHTVHPISKRLLEHLSSSYHLTQIMRFSFFAVIVTLAASITSAKACQGFLKSCMSPSDCCPDEGLQCRLLVSKSCLFALNFHLTTRLFRLIISGEWR